MKKNIKDYIGKKTAIWIDEHTPEQENAIKDLLLEDGRITRLDSGAELKELSCLSYHKKELGYCLFINLNSLTHGSKEGAKLSNFQIIPASEFLQPEFEYLEEIEVSDYEGFPIDKTRKEQYLVNRPDGKVVTWDGFIICSWNYARKINHERTEAIRMIKELMQKFNISKDEIS